MTKNERGETSGELRRIPARRILAALEQTAGRFLDPSSDARREAVLRVTESSGFSEAVVRQAIDWTFSEITAGNMRRLLISELGSDDAADDPARRSPRHILLIAAGAIFQPAVYGVVYALLVKSPITVKCSSHETCLLPLFVRTIREIDKDIGESIEALLPPQPSLPKESADLVIAYGSDETIAAIRPRVSAETKFIGHGHKISVAWIGRRAIEGETAEQTAARLAVDVAMYDQSGCLSPHCVYVETESAERVASLVARELAAVTVTLPPGRQTIEQSAAIQAFRGEYEFRSYREDGLKCFFGDNLSYTVVLDPDPAFRASPLGRTVMVKPVKNLPEALEHLKPLAGRLQGVGVSSLSEIRSCQTRLRELGASYFCEVGSMQKPPLDWKNAGIPCLGGLLS